MDATTQRLVELRDEYRDMGQSITLCDADRCAEFADHLDAILADWPEDLELRPREPTVEMMEAYRHAFVSSERFDGAKVYTAMWDAYKQERE